MTGRILPLLVALSLAGPALAREDAAAPGGELPCSSLCRSWMGLGQGAAAAPAQPTAPETAPAPAEPSKPRAAPQPKNRAAEKPRRAARAAVPLPPQRPAPAVAPPARVAAAEAPPPAAAPSVPPPGATAVTEAPALAVPPPAAAAGAAPAPEPPSSAPPPTRPSPAPNHEDVAPRDAAALSPASTPERATPWGVKLATYAALAAMVGWFFRPRPSPGEVPVAPVRRATRRRSARTEQERLQHAAVDAL